MCSSISKTILVYTGIIVRNSFVTYDREHDRIGFWKTNCSELWERLNATGAHSPAASPAGPSTVDSPRSSAVLPPEANPAADSPYFHIGITCHFLEATCISLEFIPMLFVSDIRVVGYTYFYCLLVA